MQNIENTWMREKRKLKHQFGTSLELFHTYLDEFMWICSVETSYHFGHILVSIYFMGRASNFTKLYLMINNAE